MENKINSILNDMSEVLDVQQLNKLKLLKKDKYILKGERL